MNRSELAAAIYRTAHLEGEFRLRSGRMAREYFDKYRFESDPLLLREIAQMLAPLIPQSPEMLAGLELGGIPLVTMLSQVTAMPAVFVRKQPKGYGTRRLAEGAEVAGRDLLIVEDVITTGGQVLQSAQALRMLDARVEHALIVIDREQGGRERLAAHGIELHALLTMDELRRAHG